MSVLPTPLEMGALGSAALIAAGLIFWFLKQITLAMWVGMVGGILLLCASVAYGYEAMGEAKIQPLLDAANAKLTQLDAEATQFKSEAIAARDHAVAAIATKTATIAALNKQLGERLNALPPEVANLPVPAAASVQLDTSIADANDSAIAAGAGDPARAAAAAAAASTIRDWVAWGNAVTIQYANVAAQLIAVQDYANGLAAASARAAPVK